MRCGIDCIEFMETYYNMNLKEEKEYLNSKLSDKGISIYDMTICLKKYHAKSFKSLFLPKSYPCILYLKGGHYIVLMKKEKSRYMIYDPVFQIKRIHKCIMYLQWSHIYIKIENVNGKWYT